jgi:hypothetical protein
MKVPRKMAVWFAAALTIAAVTVSAQNVPPPNTPPPAGLPQASAPMSQDFLDGLLAPIALYPDQLLAQGADGVDLPVGSCPGGALRQGQPKS